MKLGTKVHFTQWIKDNPQLLGVSMCRTCPISRYLQHLNNNSHIIFNGDCAYDERKPSIDAKRQWMQIFAKAFDAAVGSSTDPGTYDRAISAGIRSIR